MGLYSKYLGDTLSKRLAEMLEQPIGVQVSLFEELAIVRTQAVEAIRLWDAAVESPKPDSKTVQLAMEVVSGSLREVKEFCLAVSRIEKDAEDKVSLRIVGVFVDQIVRVVYRVCGEKYEGLADAIREGIEEGVRLPKSGDELEVEGTLRTPDQVVEEMDALSAPTGDVEDGMLESDDNEE